MKGILKLFPAALAVFALASCSNDQLLNLDGETTTAIEAGDLTVSFDPIEEDSPVAGTRAMRTATPSGLTFEDGDKVNVYDADLYKHDVYKFVSGTPKGKFEVDGTQRIKENAQYALFPAESVARGYWDHDMDIVKAEFRIRPIFEYDPTCETKIGDEVYYKYELPSAGKAEWNAAENRVDVKNFRALTGILQLNLTDALNNANWIRIHSTKKISGTFVVELDKENWSNIALKEGDDDLVTDNYIYVDMRQVPSRVNCVYLPILAGIDTNVDGLTVEIAKDDVNDPTTIAPASWYDTGLKFPNKVIAANKIYRGTKAFKLEDMTPNLVTSMLDQYKSSATEITLDLAKTFTINAVDAGNVIALPKFDNNVNVTINLSEDFTTWTNDDPQTLTFTDADAENPFEGTVTLNVNSKLGAKDASIDVSLAKGNFVVAGDFSTATSSDLNIFEANTVSVGDGKTPTNFAAGALTLGTVENFIVAAEAEMARDVATTANNTNVTVNGKVDGDIDMTNAVKVGTLLRIHGREANATATPAIVAKAAEVTGNVTTMCDVKIDLTAEGIAIAAGKALTLNGYDNTLTLVQGYVDKFVASVQNTGSWETSQINVVLNDENEGLAAIKTIDAQNDANGTLTKINFTESVWDGNVIGAAFTDYKGKTTSYQENSTPKTGKAVFTASQLASLTTQDVLLVANDINLNNKEAWAGFELTDRMQGYLPGETVDDAHTISGLNLTVANGLIKQYTGAANATINGLKIVGVTANKAATAKGVGALIAMNKATAGTLTIEDVAISDINIAAASGTQLLWVGGVIGLNTNDIVLNRVSVAGTIDGYSGVGGLVGRTSSNNVTVTDCDAEGIVFAATYDSGKKMDIEYATRGGFIGNVQKATAITITGGKVPASINYGFDGKMYVSDTSASTGDFFDYSAKQNYIGYSGTNATQKITACTIDGDAYCAEAEFGETDEDHVVGTVTHTYLYIWPAQE